MADLIEKLPRRCTATSRKTGEPCGNRAMVGLTVCKQHGGQEDVGRRTRLTEETTTRICQAIEAGCYREVACGYAEIGISSFKRWMAQGRLDDEADVNSACRQFRASVLAAEARFEVHATASIYKSGTTKDWRASAFLLERTRPERWGRKDRVEHAGNLNVTSRSPVEDLFPAGPAAVSLATRQKIAELLEAQLAEGGDGMIRPEVREHIRGLIQLDRGAE